MTGAFCPECLERGETVITHTTLDGQANEDGTLHRHCELCGEEAIGATELQVQRLGLPTSRGAWWHLDSTDCPGSWGYDEDDVPFWGSNG